MNHFFMLQIIEAPQVTESYFHIMMKGGWIMYPIFILYFIAVFIIFERSFTIIRMKKTDNNFTYQICDRIHQGDIDSACRMAQMNQSASSGILLAGLSSINFNDEIIVDSMKTESGNQVFKLEKNMSYLGIIASVAPMMGFLGTIFGVIKIFYSISASNDLSISTISEGLYQKMICSGAGLLVGIIAYAGYQILNRKIDIIIHKMDESSNEVLKAIRCLKKEKP